MARPPGAVSLLTGAALTLLAGCGHHNAVVLLQPDAPPSQQHIEMNSDVACSAPAGQWQKCLLTFPLPGTQRGPRAFVVYLWAPNAVGELPVNPADPNGVRGFLIQELGHRAGRTDFVSGTVTFKKLWLRPQKRKVCLDVVCDDGTAIRGQAVVVEAATTLQSIEREFAADVANLTASETQSDAPHRTGARHTPAP